MIELLGYIASALVLCAFCTKTMVLLRLFAIASNATFIVYGALQELPPVLMLHSILLPLNAWRLLQVLRLGRLVRAAASAGESQLFASLAPVAGRFRLRRGDVVIRKGDPSDALYLVVAGTLRVIEAGITVGPGTVIGEIGVLSTSGTRTATVTALTDCVLGRISARDFRRLYYTDPALGLRLVRLVIDRLSADGAAQRTPAHAGAAVLPM